MKIVNDFGVRALFGTLIIGGFVASCFYGMIYKPQILVFVKDCFTPIVMAIVAFYFGQKSVKGGD